MCPSSREHSESAAASADKAGKARFPTVPIFGVSFSKMSMDETVRYLTNAIRKKRSMHVITGNPIMVMAALENPEFKEAMEGADLVVPDGAGIVWASRFVGEPVTERVAGFDLLHRLMETGELEGWSAYLLGTTQETIEAAAQKLQEKYPKVRIAGFRSGFFGADEDAEVVAAIRSQSPDLLFVARALNNQETWISKYKEELGVPVMMGVGGSFDIISGRIKRAPRLFQKLGLEWFYRLLTQPTRLKRMLVLPKFAVKVIREKENVTKRG